MKDVGKPGVNAHRMHMKELKIEFSYYLQTMQNHTSIDQLGSGGF